MHVLIPMEKADPNSKISLVSEAKSWAVVEVGEGKIKDISFYGNRHDIDKFIDSVVVKDKNDFVSEFFEESIPVLEAPSQRTIEDIMEAYMFCQLYEVSIKS